MNEENDRIAIGYDEIVVPLARSQTVSTLSIKNEEKGTMPKPILPFFSYNIIYFFCQDKKQEISSKQKNENANQNENSNTNKEENESDDPPREVWSKKLDFLMSIIGFSVDLAGVWRL